MKRKIIIISAVVCLLAAIFAFVALSQSTPKLLRNYSSEEELLSELNNEEFEQLKDEVNEAGDKYEYSELAYYAYAIKEKIREIPGDVITGLVTSKINAKNLRYMLLDVCDNESSPILLDYDKLVKMLLDPEEDSSLRSAVIVYLNQPYTYEKQEGFSDILYALCFDEDDKVSEIALQGLYSNDRQMAVPIIKTILYDKPEKFAPKAFNRAITYMARELTYYSSDYEDGKESERYLDLCKSLLDENRCVMVVTDALMDMQTPEQTVFVLKHPNVDDLTKLYCVFHNYYQLREWVFEGGVTAEKAEFYIDCLNYFPINQAISDLEMFLADAPTLFGERTEEMSEKISEMIDEIEENGSDAYSKGGY
jgi:hypothetical protein